MSGCYFNNKESCNFTYPFSEMKLSNSLFSKSQIFISPFRKGGLRGIFNAFSITICILLFCSINLNAATLEPKTGARPLGMAAYSAVSDDINAMCYNPAGLSLIQTHELSSAYAPLYGFDSEILQSYLAYAYPAGRWGTFGINFSYLDYGDMDWRDNSGEALGTFSRTDYSFYASYGLRVIESIAFGLSAGYNSVGMDAVDEFAGGVGFDAGLLYTIASKISLGLNVENLGGVSAADMEIARQKIRTGVAVSALDRGDMGLIIAMDLEEQQGKTDSLYTGFEYSIFSPSSFFIKRKIQERYINLSKKHGQIVDYSEGVPEQNSRISLCLRGGLRKRFAVSEPISLSGGVSIKYIAIPGSLTIKLDHAFSWHRYMDSTQRFSLGLEMGDSAYN
ncbi:PorV/PorQ family protein [Candidatus Poribacteria bacterium]|nr:PorV/PorQ family protein [Candidatus Poribacteria bacterium]